MGVTTTKTNKPLNPRGNDQSPLAFNRAKLYSGKALDFDGVNDSVSVSSITDTYKSFCFYFKPDADINDASSLQRLFGIYEQYFGISTGAATGSVTGETLVFMPNSGGRFGTRMEFTANTWYHIAVVAKESDNTYLIYINAQDKTDFSVNTHTPTAATDLKLAVANNGGPHFNGQIANFKAFNVALTAAQVADLYNNPEKVVPTGVDNTALKLWLPMMEGAGTTAINGAPDALGSELITNGGFDSSSNWSGTNVSVSNGVATFNGVGSQESTLFQANIPISTTSGTLHAFTYTVTSNTLQGSASFFAGFRTNNECIQKANIPMTVGTHVVYGNSVGTGNGFSLHTSVGFTGGSLVIDNISVKEASGFGTISGATWTHGIGAPVAQTAVINWNKYNTGANAVLIPQGLTAGRDLLGNLFENVRKQGALNLDGNSWAEVHDNESVDVSEFTLEGWVYTNSITSDNRILSKWFSGYPNRTFQFSATNDDLYLYISDGSSSNNTFVLNVLSLNNWYHCVATYDGANLKIYLDGVLKVTTASTMTLKNSNEPVYIGAYVGSLDPSDNTTAQPRIYNRALTAEEVQRSYDSGKNIFTNS